MLDKFPDTFAAADPAAQFDVIQILFGDDMMPDLLDVLAAFDEAAPHIQAACLVAVGLVTQ
tara:strand:- start:489 stop:671 length:183 start_codon:yes stop_codon:yes gene_type:complete